MFVCVENVSKRQAYIHSLYGTNIDQHEREKTKKEKKGVKGLKVHQHLKLGALRGITLLTSRRSYNKNRFVLVT